ncbi:MAG: PEGA domain-containing protein [Ignavibacteria bacterium]|nr:PEGA domain-containing protein [Ignavibacteria bacterium]
MKNLLIGAIVLLNLTYGQIVIQDSVETIKPSLTIYSYPENATVYANDSILGTTPLNIQELKAGSNKIIVKIDSSKKMEYDFNFPLKENLIVHSVLEKEYGYYTFNTDPIGAKVFLNDSLWGITPLKVKVPIGKYYIKYELDGYSDLDVFLTITSIRLDHFRKMEPKYSILNIENKEAINRIFIDDVEFDINDFNDLKFNPRLSKQLKTNIRVELADKVTFKEEDIRLQTGNSYAIRVTDNNFSPFPALRSALLPGLGQIVEGKTTKGISIMSGFALMSALTVLSIDAASERKNNFEDAKTNYSNAKDIFNAVKMREIVTDTRNSYDKYKTLKQISISLLIGVYVYNLVDVIINDSSVKEVKVINTNINFSSNNNLTYFNFSYNF